MPNGILVLISILSIFRLSKFELLLKNKKKSQKAKKKRQDNLAPNTLSENSERKILYVTCLFSVFCHILSFTIFTPVPGNTGTGCLQHSCRGRHILTEYHCTLRKGHLQKTDCIRTVALNPRPVPGTNAFLACPTTIN